MNNIIKALNLTEGLVLTLEKLPDRIEFEAIVLLSDSSEKKNDDCFLNVCPLKISCGNCNDICDCVGPAGYISLDDCHPYSDCSANNCRPVQ